MPATARCSSALREAFAAMTDVGRSGGGACRSQVCAPTPIPRPGSLFVRMVIEADQGRYSPALLEELNWRLQEHYLRREISRACVARWTTGPT